MTDYILRGKHSTFESVKRVIENSDIRELIAQLDCLYEMGYEIEVDTVRGVCERHFVEQLFCCPGGHEYEAGKAHPLKEGSTSTGDSDAGKES